MLQENLQGISLTLETEPDLFSPRNVDMGTKAMLSFVSLNPTDKVLDLGCGYGPVGIWVAKQIPPEQVTLCDVNPAAVSVARGNADLNGVSAVRIFLSDGLDGVPDTGYTLILSNPPYHTDFHVAKRFIEKGFNRLTVGGRMFMVTKRIDWYRQKLTAVFGGCKVHPAGEYTVFEAEKRSTQRGKPSGR